MGAEEIDFLNPNYTKRDLKQKTEDLLMWLRIQRMREI
jgi:hypothetical protein